MAGESAELLKERCRVLSRDIVSLILIVISFRDINSRPYIRSIVIHIHRLTRFLIKIKNNFILN